jgi:tryptophan synthase alpha chain
VSERIRRAFTRAAKQKRAAFVPFVMTGDPTVARTLEVVRALEDAGADLLELGVPFTDPIADGPVIQRASERALGAGTTLSVVLQAAGELRHSCDLPLVLFSYFNPVHAYGLPRFAVDAAAAGIDAVLLTDVPAEEMTPIKDALGRVDIDVVPLVAPTSTRPRIRAVRKLAGEFVYLIARTGVTGARTVFGASLADQVKLVRKLSGTRVAVGFGVSTPEQVHGVARIADGVVVGSALVRRIEELGDVPGLAREVGATARTHPVKRQAARPALWRWTSGLRTVDPDRRSGPGGGRSTVNCRRSRQILLAATPSPPRAWRRDGRTATTNRARAGTGPCTRRRPG